MNNILAITHKELKSYFASPIAYVVIGLYALVYGYYFYAAVRFFERQSIQMAGLGAGTPAVNINEQLIRPVFQYSMVVFLIVPVGPLPSQTPPCVFGSVSVGSSNGVHIRASSSGKAKPCRAMPTTTWGRPSTVTL